MKNKKRAMHQEQEPRLFKSWQSSILNNSDNLDNASKFSTDTSLDVWRRARLQTVLHKSILRNDVELSARCLRLGADVGQVYDPNGQTLLHLASSSGQARMCALLCRAGADPNAPDDRQFGPIHLACMQGHKTVVRILLHHGADVRLKNEYGDPALHTTVRYDHVCLLPYLLCQPLRVLTLPARRRTKGGLVQEQQQVEHVNLQNDNGDTPLHIAVALGRKRMAKNLLRHGASCFIRNNQDMNAFDIASQKRNARMIRMMRKSVGLPRTNSQQNILSTTLPSSEDSELTVNDAHEDQLLRYRPDTLQPRSYLEPIRPKNTDVMSNTSKSRSNGIKSPVVPQPGSVISSNITRSSEHNNKKPKRDEKVKDTTASAVNGSPMPPYPRSSSLFATTKSSQHCYHHHIEDPTKVVELDPLPNNLLSLTRSNDGYKDRFTFKEQKELRSPKGGVQVLPSHSASLEDKLNEISTKHSASLNRRIHDLSLSVKEQLEKMNTNLEKQEESIKKSLKKSKSDRENPINITVSKKEAGAQTIPPPPPKPDFTKPMSVPKPPPTSTNIPVHVVTDDPKTTKAPPVLQHKAIDPDKVMDKLLSSSYDETWLREERTFVVRQKKQKADHQPSNARRRVRWHRNTPTITDTSDSSDELLSSDSDSSESSLTSSTFDFKSNSDYKRRCGFQNGHSQYNTQTRDIFGSRIGRVSPKIREIQDQLREAQLNANKGNSSRVVTSDEY